MTTPQVYVLDANTFIQAARQYYAFDLAPAFWNHLIRLASEGRIRSIDRIRQELERGNDELAEWIKSGNLRDAFVSTSDDDVIQCFRDIMIWVQNNNQLFDAAKARFANDSDGWLVAYARAKGSILVTHEGLHTEARSRVPIPNLCQAFDVPFVNTFEMLRALGVRLA